MQKVGKDPTKQGDGKALVLFLECLRSWRGEVSLPRLDGFDLMHADFESDEVAVNP